MLKGTQNFAFTPIASTLIPIVKGNHLYKLVSNLSFLCIFFAKKHMCACVYICVLLSFLHRHYHTICNALNLVFLLKNISPKSQYITRKNFSLYFKVA